MSKQERNERTNEIGKKQFGASAYHKRRMTVSHTCAPLNRKLVHSQRYGRKTGLEKN
jgi:hypothetical protein